MYISPNDVEAALLRIFTELQIPAGASLSRNYLLKRWSENRLRHSDLDATLGRLVRSRKLSAKDTFEGRAFVLTELGQLRAAAQQTGKLHRMLYLLRLSLAQVLRPAGERQHDALHHRRLIDRAAPRI